MARKLIVEIIGDASSLEKSYRSAERGTKRFGQSIEKAGRGAVVASVGFKGLGRSVAFASSSFLGGAGLAFALQSTISAAEESQRVLAQTQNAVERSGLSWAQYGDRIQAAALATANLSGFDDERLLQTFSNLVRRTGDVNRALTLNALAADVARGRNIELEQAAQLVLKASLGQAGALRRVGISAKQGASGIELVNSLQQKFAGSAAAYGKTAAGAQDRFRVALQNTQETIGAALLPAITKLLDKASTWLSDTKNQAKLQRDLNTAVRDGVTVFHDLGVSIKFASDRYREFKNLGGDLPGGKDGFFSKLLTGSLPAQIGDLSKRIHHLGDELGLTGKKAEQTGNIFAGLVLNIESAVGHMQAAIANVAEPTNVLDTQHGGGTYPTINTRPGSPGLTRGQRTAVALARAQAVGNRQTITAAVNARIAFVSDTIAFANKLIRQHRGDTKQLADTLQSLYSELGSDQAVLAGFHADDVAAAQKAAELAKKRAAAAKKAAEQIAAANQKRLEAVAKQLEAGRRYTASFQKLLRKRAAENAAARQRVQYRALGLTDAGDERLPKPEALLNQLRKLRTAIRGTDQDTRANRTFLMGAIGDLLGRHGPVTQATVAKINDFYTSVHEALAKGSKTTLTYFKHLSAEAIVDSLGGGLTGAQRRRLEVALSGLGPGLTVPARRSTAYAAGIHPGIVVHEAHFHGVENMSQFEDEIVRRARARAYRRRGAR